MRIGLLVPEMPPDFIGGGGIVFEALAENLVRRGHNVVVVAGATYGGPPDTDSNRPYRVLRVPEFRHPSPAYRTSMPPVPGRAFVQAMRALRSADVVNAHGYACPLVDLSALFLDARRLVFTLHGFLFTIPAQGGAIAAAYRAYDAVLGSRALMRARRVTAVSNAVAEAARARGRPDCRVIHNGFETSPPRELAPTTAAEAARGPYLLCVGRLQWLKGFDVALEALAALRSRGHDLRLLIAGQDAGFESELLAARARLGIEDAVSLLGYVPNHEVATLLRGCVAFMLTSRTEALSVAAMEAMNAGAPAVLARVGGIPDLATHEREALLIEGESGLDFANAIERLMRDARLRSELTANARKRMEEFSWQKVTRLYEGVYEEVLASRLAPDN